MDAKTVSISSSAPQQSLRSGGQLASPTALADWQAYRPALQNAILTANAESVSKILAPLPVAQRLLLLNSPLVETNDGPRLPLCIAAQGGVVAVMHALLQAPGAVPYLGEAGDDTVTTALYWAATAGCSDVMSLLHDGYDVPRDQVLLATQERALPAVLKWLRQHDLPPEELLPALQSAVDADEPEQIDELIRIGGANPNSLAPNGDTLLQFAIRVGRIESAEMLLQRGAGVSAAVPPEQQPLALAVMGGHCALAARLVRQGASAGVSTLKLALERESGAGCMYAMLATANVLPTNVGEAADLQRMAQLKDAPGLLLLITLQHNRLARAAALANQKLKPGKGDPLLSWIDTNERLLLGELTKPSSLLGAAGQKYPVSPVALEGQALPVAKGRTRRAAHKVFKTLNRATTSSRSAAAPPAMADDSALALVPRRR